MDLQPRPLLPSWIANGPIAFPRQWGHFTPVAPGTNPINVVDCAARLRHALHPLPLPIGTNVEEFIKMNEVTEELIWESNEEATFKRENIIEIKNDKGKTIGTKKEYYNQKTNAKEIKDGIENMKEMNDKNSKEIKKLKRQLKNLGEIPVKTNEMIRTERNLKEIIKINKAKELTDKIRPIEINLEETEKIINKRIEFLKKRPK